MAFSRRSKSMNSSSYIGSGNQSFVFNRRPKNAFERIRGVYGEHILGETGSLDHTSYGNLSKAEKERIRYRVRHIIERQKKRQFYAYIWFSLTCLIGFIIVVAIMNSPQ